VVGFEEKPADPKPIPGDGAFCLASMGIYIFSARFLFDELCRDATRRQSQHDFGGDVIPTIIDINRVFAYLFLDDIDENRKQVAYWRDVGTLDAYYDANMDLVSVDPQLNMYDEQWPIRTYQAQLPPAKFVFDDDDRRGMAVDSMVSAGCIVSGSKISHSLLSNNVRVHSYSVIKNSVLLPNVVVGRNCQIANAVIDSDCRLPENTVIGENLEADRKHFHVTPEGIVLVCPEMLGQKVRYGI